MSQNLNPRQFFAYSPHEDGPAWTHHVTWPEEREIDVKPGALHTDQDVIRKDALEQYRRGEGTPVVGHSADYYGARPTVTEHEGSLWVDDGHHRLAAAMSNGPTRVRVNYRHTLDELDDDCPECQHGGHRGGGHR